MRTLIIGGTGLISTSITRQLLDRGAEVTLFNRGQSEVRFPAGAKFIYGDRKDFETFVRQIREAGTFDCVIEMICYTPEEAESLIRACEGRAGQVIFCSTVDVYARPAYRYPYLEDEPREAVSDYGRNKARCEDLLMEAHQRGAFHVTTIRPAHTYGEGRGLIHSLGGSTTYLDRLRKGKPIVVHGDGTSLWVSCHIDDVARAFISAIGIEQAFGKSYHVTGEEWMAWNTYHHRVAEAMCAPTPQLVHMPTDLLAEAVPDRAGVCKRNFQYSTIFNNSAARADLGFEYTIPFVEGARRTIQWLEEHGRIENSDNDPLDDFLIDSWKQLQDQFVQQVHGWRQSQ